MLFKRKEREEALKFLKSYQEPIGALIFHILLNFRVKSLFEERIGVALNIVIMHQQYDLGNGKKMEEYEQTYHMSLYSLHSEDENLQKWETQTEYMTRNRKISTIGNGDD